MKIRRLMAGLTLAATIGTVMMPVTAFAQVDEEAILEEEQEEVVEEPAEDPEEIIAYNPLTPDGNLTIIDDYGDPTKAGKQFITVSSKNGNIFYIIIDRDDEGENTVHFLNLVDERDLLNLMDEEEIEELMGTTEVEPTPTPEPVETEVEVIPEEPKQKSNVGGGSIFIVAVLLVAGIGVFLYTKKKDVKKKNSPYVDPDADYEDDDYEDDIPEEEEEPIDSMEDESFDEDLSDE